jgi:hypothetical protein
MKGAKPARPVFRPVTKTTTILAAPEFEHDPDAVGDDIEAMQEGLRRVLAELRDFAQGIHPSVLSDRGLLVAIETLAGRHSVRVEDASAQPSGSRVTYASPCSGRLRTLANRRTPPSTGSVNRTSLARSCSGVVKSCTETS